MSFQAPNDHELMGLQKRSERRAVLSDFNPQGLPPSFVDRLVNDSQSNEDIQRISSVAQIRLLDPNSSYCGVSCAPFCCRQGTLVVDGEIGRLRRGNEFLFLGSGFHSFWTCANEINEQNVSISTVNKPVVNGSTGFLVVTESNVGVAIVGSSYKILAPGTYQWSSPRVRILEVTSIVGERVKLGPYSLITVPVGCVAVTFHNGELRILGHEPDARSDPTHDAAAKVDGGSNTPKRTYFLDDPKWEFRCFLPTVMQTDRLEGNDLLSKDNVEVLMVAMSQWRVVDPELAVTNCSPTMEDIRVKVNQLVRATIARIVAGTNIGAGPVSGSVAHPVVAARAVTSESVPTAAGEPDLSHLMQSSQASKHMAELAVQMTFMGIEVAGVYVPEKRMKNDDIRSEVAKQAVIGIKAEAERAAADATAYATVKSARAQAEAIGLLATAHAEAGQRLGAPESTAARLALTETLSKSMDGAKLTVFSGPPDALPFMFGRALTSS